MKHFRCSLYMCFPHIAWLKEWQRYQTKNHNNVKCKEKCCSTRILPPVAYVYDDQIAHRCFVCTTPRADALEVRNWTANHICIDGGLIRHGCRFYMPNPNSPITSFPQGRCDSMVFDKKDIWFIEFKMNTTTVSDTQLWEVLKGGMKQLKDFINNLRCKMAAKRTPLHRYFKLTHQHCTVCMKTYPRMNTTRNNYLEKFRIETGIKLLQTVIIP